MDEANGTQRQRKLPQFSLLSALSLMTIVGLAIVIVQLWREVGPLRAEVSQLRKEVGVIVVEDPTRPCAIRVRTSDDFTWKWRLWIPEGRSYLLKYSGGAIPKSGFPKANGTIAMNEPGETWIEYRIHNGPGYASVFDKLTTPNASVGSSSQEWTQWTQRASLEEGVGYETQVGEPAKIFVIIRKRVSPVADSKDIKDPSSGFMIWLEPTK